MRLKRLKTALLCLVLCIAAVPQSVFADGTYMINGRYVSASDYGSSPGECWVYAQNVYTKIWGEYFSNSFYSEDNMLRGRATEELELNAENLRRYIGAAPAGAVLRVTSIDYLYDTDAVGHSQIIVDKDDNGFTVFEGGMGVWPYRFENYYTWEQYVDTWYNYNHAYIKYIKWPGYNLYTDSYADSCESFPSYVVFTVKALAEEPEEPAPGGQEEPGVPSGDIVTPEVPDGDPGSPGTPGTPSGDSETPEIPETPGTSETPPEEPQPAAPATGFRSQPCRPATDASSEFIAVIPEGTVLTATRLFKNTAGEYWYRCSWEGRTGYIFCGEAETGEDISEAVLDNLYVTGTMPYAGTVGRPIDLPITVHSNLLDIACVEGWIEELGGTRILPDFSNSIDVNRRSIYLYNSYVDNTITFGKLPEGTFRFVLSVTLRYFFSSDGAAADRGDLVRTFTSEFTMTPPPPPPYRAGDVDGDAEITAGDLTILARHVAKTEPLASEEALSAADVNRDGFVNADDLTLLSRYVARIITGFE